jgi:hypothetical protein
VKHCYLVTGQKKHINIMKTSTSDGKKRAADAFTKAFVSQKPTQKPKKYQVKSSKSGSNGFGWFHPETNPR